MENRERLFRYLLGDLPPDEQVCMQKDAMADHALREDLREAESDLIDSYVCQRLSDAQRNRFETWFLDSAEKRERVEMAQILLSAAVRRLAPVPECPGHAASPGTRIKPAWWNWLASPHVAWTMAILVFAIATMVVVVQNLRWRDELKRSMSTEANSRNQIAALTNQISELRRSDRVTTDQGGSGAKGEVSLLLSSGQQRSGENANGPATLKLAPLPAVALRLELEQDFYPGYDVSVKTAEGREIWQTQGLKSQLTSRGEHVIVARLPSELLAAGDYIVKVSAQTSRGELRSVDAYAFTVTR